MADPKMVMLLAALGVAVHVKDVEYAASIYIMTNTLASNGNEAFKSKRSDNALEILKFLHNIGIDTSFLATSHSMLKRYMYFEALEYYESFLIDLQNSEPNYTNFELYFDELADEYAFNFTRDLKCPQRLCKKLKSGFYGLDPDILCRDIVERHSDEAAKLLGSECDG